ncbi:MAG: HAMP domain-containing sensor histidine kinase [Ginsengibacter sp.]
MKTKRFSIFRRISILVFSLITILCLLFMGLTYYSTTNFHEASTQLLNKDVAAHIAKFTSPFENDGINKKKADSVFYDAMVLSPSAEVYFLDTAGRVIAYHAEEKEIKQWVVPLENIKKLIVSKGTVFIKNTDPKHPDVPKIFSAADVVYQSKSLGYIYVILGSNTDVTNMLYKSYFSNLFIKVFLLIIVVSIIFTFIYLNRFQKSFNHMIVVLKKFEEGDFRARFTSKEDDELAPVTTAFNNMADLLVYNIDRLTKSEQERKEFIANISHDLRTPLSIARGYTETLMMNDEKHVHEQQEFVQLVYRKIRQVEHMVKQLFDLSKMESVDFTPKKEPFIFLEILQELIHASASSAAEKNININCSACTNSSWITADIGMMERVIQNLLVNAIKYTPENGSIIISIEQKMQTLIFKIGNSGHVLNADTVKWFNNLSDDTLLHNRPSTSGIGLVIVKKILHLHQYKFELITEESVGNTFIIHIPIQPGPD